MNILRFYHNYKEFLNKYIQTGSDLFLNPNPPSFWNPDPWPCFWPTLLKSMFALCWAGPNTASPDGTAAPVSASSLHIILIQYRETQSAYTYYSRLIYTSALYSYIRGPAPFNWNLRVTSNWIISRNIIFKYYLFASLWYYLTSRLLIDGLSNCLLWKRAKGLQYIYNMADFFTKTFFMSLYYSNLKYCAVFGMRKKLPDDSLIKWLKEKRYS